MAQHYAYEDPDRTALKQGDVLERSDELLDVLREVHPHYANHEQYRYFVVLTQTCDLVRRGGGPPKSRYISIAAVRPIEEALRREAADLQEPWQRAARVISTKGRDKLAMFLARLIDNNEPGYFYLHPDPALGLAERYCAFLALSVALRAEHYTACLRAKRLELKETFQAKLGWLVGNMYSRVAATEWNEVYRERPLDKEIADLLKATFVIFDERQLREAIEELEQSGGLATRTPEEIAEHVSRKRVQPRKKKLNDRAVEVLRQVKLVEMVRDRALTILRGDTVLQEELTNLVASPSPKAEGTAGLGATPTANEILDVVSRAMKRAVTDELLPSREKVVKALVGQIVEDAIVDRILRD